MVSYNHLRSAIKKAVYHNISNRHVDNYILHCINALLCYYSSQIKVGRNCRPFLKLPYYIPRHPVFRIYKSLYDSVDINNERMSDLSRVKTFIHIIYVFNNKFWKFNFISRITLQRDMHVVDMPKFNLLRYLSKMSETSGLC